MGSRDTVYSVCTLLELMHSYHSSSPVKVAFLHFFLPNRMKCQQFSDEILHAGN